MGAAASRAAASTPGASGDPSSTAGERTFGLENYGNTCYANSVLQVRESGGEAAKRERQRGRDEDPLDTDPPFAFHHPRTQPQPQPQPQALYFCRPFRERVLAYAAANAAAGVPPDSSLLASLGDLFAAGASGGHAGGGGGGVASALSRAAALSSAAARARPAVLGPRRFVARLRSDFPAPFASPAHQDAHEFLNCLLNAAAEELRDKAKEKEEADAGGHGGDAGEAGGAAATASSSSSSAAAAAPAPAATAARLPPPTWVDEVFQGDLVNETKCLGCEAVTARAEPFYDLSLEVGPHTSLAACLRQFAGTETLAGPDKFWCARCGGLQEAQKRLRIARLPRHVLALHLKRFKYTGGGYGGGGGGAGGAGGGAAPRLRKLGHRVAFPFELKLGPAAAVGAGRAALGRAVRAAAPMAGVGARTTATSCFMSGTRRRRRQWRGAGGRGQMGEDRWGEVWERGQCLFFSCIAALLSCGPVTLHPHHPPTPLCSSPRVLLALQRHHKRPRRPSVPVLIQVNALPRPQRKAPPADGDGHGTPRDGGRHVGGHVIVALIRVRPGRAQPLRDGQPVPRVQVPPDI